MPVTIHSVRRYTVQVLTKKIGDEPRSSIIVRLYDASDKHCGSAVFETHGDLAPPPPVGDFEAKTANSHMDLRFYQAFIDILRREDELFWKIAWVQARPVKEVSDVSLDTKKEIIGDFFPLPREA